jgi:hypothetical protein
MRIEIAHRTKNPVISIRCSPKVHRTLADVVKEGSSLASPGQYLDFPEFNPDPFSLDTLLVYSNFDRLERKISRLWILTVEYI